MILFDTHVVLWLSTDPGKLSNKAKAAIENARKNGEGLAICDVTLLELATMANKGGLRMNISLEDFMKEIEDRFTILPITGRACLRTMKLPAGYPKDPADRIIGATALAESLSLLTADKEILRSGAISTIW